MERAIKKCPICGGKLTEQGECSRCGITVLMLYDGLEIKSPNNTFTVSARNITKKTRSKKVCEGVYVSVDVFSLPKTHGPRYKYLGMVDEFIDLGRPATVKDFTPYLRKAYKAAEILYSKYDMNHIEKDCEQIFKAALHEPEKTQLTAKAIAIDLIDWSKPYPTGAIAYDSNDSVIDSAYCDNADEFAEFFDTHRKEINSDTELAFKISSEDFDILELEKLVYSIRDAFWKILEGGNNNEI